MKVMYKQTKNTIGIILIWFLKLLPYSLFIYFQNRKKTIYSTWINLQIKNCGNKVHFDSINLLKGKEFIKIGNNTSFGEGLYLTAWKFEYSKVDPTIIIEDNCSFGAYNHITSCNKIVIGKGCLTGKWVTITDNSHGDTDYQTLHMIPTERKVISKGAVIIGENVWIGDKVTILPGVEIGNGVVIGANSVVTKDIPSYCVVGGNPAKVIKQL